MGRWGTPYHAELLALAHFFYNFGHTWLCLLIGLCSEVTFSRNGNHMWYKGLNAGQASTLFLHLLYSFSGPHFFLTSPGKILQAIVLVLFDKKERCGRLDARFVLTSSIFSTSWASLMC